jgi:hypothetical protein
MVVIVEAKNRKAFKDLGRSHIQDWVDVLIKKLEIAPTADDFLKKFSYDDDAQFSVGLIASWVRETNTFDANVLADRLKQIEVVEKKKPIFIYMLDNSRITKMLSVYDEVNRLTGTGEYKEPVFYYPPNGSDFLCDGSVIPIEALFSDILLYRVTKRELIKSRGEYDEYPAVLVFYFGQIHNIADLEFIDLAIRDLGLHEAKEIEVYITSSTNDIRSEIATRTRLSKFNLVFKRLSVRTDLPSWLVES